MDSIACEHERAGGCRQHVVNRQHDCFASGTAALHAKLV